MYYCTLFPLKVDHLGFVKIILHFLIRPHLTQDCCHFCVFCLVWNNNFTCITQPMTECYGTLCQCSICPPMSLYVTFFLRRLIAKVVSIFYITLYNMCGTLGILLKHPTNNKLAAHPPFFLSVLSLPWQM